MVFYIIEEIFFTVVKLDKLKYIDYLINLLVISLKTKLLNKSKNSLCLLLIHKNKDIKTKSYADSTSILATF